MQALSNCLNKMVDGKTTISILFVLCLLASTVIGEGDEIVFQCACKPREIKELKKEIQLQDGKVLIMRNCIFFQCDRLQFGFNILNIFILVLNFFGLLRKTKMT